MTLTKKYLSHNRQSIYRVFIKTQSSTTVVTGYYKKCSTKGNNSSFALYFESYIEVVDILSIRENRG